MSKNKHNKKKAQYFSSVILGLVLIGVLFAAFDTNTAWAWPRNRLDSANSQSYCTSCHSRTTGTLSIIDVKVDGTSKGSTTSASVPAGGALEITFRSTGMGYNKFTASGAVRVADTSKWGIGLADTPWSDNGRSDTTPWAIAQQTTQNGAPLNSPYMFTTDFPAADTAQNQRGVTYDNGNTGTPGDRNRLTHNEVFNVKLTVPSTTGTYTIYVQGVGSRSDGNLAYNQVSFSVTVTDDTTTPSIPTGVTVGGATGSSLDVSWTASTDSSGIKRYDIYRSADGGSSYILVGTATTTSFTDNDLLQSTTYYYKIKAVDNANNVSDFSSPASGATTGDARNDTKAPSTPTEFTALAGNKKVTVSWKLSPEADIVTYRIQRSTTSGDFTGATEFTVDGAASFYIDTTTDNGKTYYYRVRAEDVASKTSAYTGEVSALPTVDQGEIQPHGLFNVNGRKDLCQYCHSTHTSTGKELLLKKTTEDTCYLCHDGSGSKYNTKADYDVQKNPTHHKVPEGKTFCSDCHNPHFTLTDSTSATTGKKNGSIRLLAAERYGNGPNYKGNAYCWTCHGDNSELPRPFGLNHQTYFNNSGHGNIYAENVVTANSDPNGDNIIMAPPESGTEIICVKCHEYHGSKDFPLLNSTNSSNFCINCHTDVGFTDSYTKLKKGTGASERKLPNSSNHFIGSPHEVEFYGRNGCTMCHEPHGTEYNFMIKDIFPTEGASVKRTDLMCFTCHDYRYYIGSGGNKPINGSRFGAGNGENMHWHVDERDELNALATCRVCHDPHSGNNQVYDGYQSNWNLNNPVNVSFDWSYMKNRVLASGNGRLAFVATGYDSAGEPTGFACHMRCDKDHQPIGYIRKTTGPTLNCAACHSYEEFEVNSAHPIVYPGTESGKYVSCETCHEGDHLKHTSSNPYGLKNPVDWKDPGDNNAPVNPNPVSIPYFNEYGYREFCVTCHGTERSITAEGDYQIEFEGKPHAELARPTNPYGTAADGTSKDMPCLACHEHHASTNVRLLKRDIDTTDSHSIDADTDRGKIDSCLDCHDGYPAKQNIDILYNSPKSAGHFIRSVDATKKLLCIECHSPHGTGNDNYLWDRDKYDVFRDSRNSAAQVYGAAYWPTGMTNGTYDVRIFCLKCHPTSDVATTVYYDTYKTIKIASPGETGYVLQIVPMPASIVSHASTSNDQCSMCHDPHKPWPATGSNADCYMCHGNTGEAKNIEILMGLEGTSSTGKTSKHKIYDPLSADTNDCMTACHAAHPHQPRANVLNQQVEKDVCFKCHKDSASGTQPKIIEALYTGKPHDYDNNVHSYSDGSSFAGNCIKCHVPHGSDYAPLLRWENGDSLCTQCHNGTTTDADGNKISNIKTRYDKYGHYYSADPTKKLRCAECHIPHGSTNSMYLRDNGSATIYTDGDLAKQRHFPENLGPNEPRKSFCITCHLYSDADPATDGTYVRYYSTSAPGLTGYVDIAKLPFIGVKTGLTLTEHSKNDATSCDLCHDAHDPRPTGGNKDCYACHGGDNAITTDVEALAGRWNHIDAPGVNSWPDGAGGRTTLSSVVSFHRIIDPMTADSNTCMLYCHKSHNHNPKSDMIKDLRNVTVDTEAPITPTMQAAYASSNVQINLPWSYVPAGTEDVAGYYVYRDSYTTPIGILSSTATDTTLTFKDGGVTGAHSYKVKTFDKAGNVSGFGTEQSATATYLSDTEKPTAPTNLKLSVLSSNRISLAWDRSTDNSLVKGYNIYRSIDGSTFTKIGYTGSISFVDGAGSQDSLAPNTKYYYYVKALDVTADYGGSGNESDASTTVTGTTSKVGNGVSYGNYWNGNYKIQIFNSSNAHTNQVAEGSSVRLKVTLPGVSNPARARVTVQSYLAATVAGPYNFAQTSSTDPYTYEVTFTAPTAGLYRLYFEFRNNSGTDIIRAYEALECQTTTRKFRTYSDSGYTTEATEFEAGQTVYVEVFGNSGTIDNANSTKSLTGWNLNTITNLTLTSGPTWNGNYIRYAFTMPTPSGVTAGDWISLYNRWRTGGGTTLTDMYKQIRYVVPDSIAPAAPTLNAPTTTATTASLSWTASPESDLAGYTIYRQEGAGSFIKAGSVSKSTTTFIDTGLKPSTSYTYKVSAYDAASNVATSGTQSVNTQAAAVDSTGPSTPNGVSIIALGSDSIQVSWTANSASEEVAGYNVFRLVKLGGTDVWLKLGATSGTHLTDGGLAPSTVYSYRVTAFDLSSNESATTATKTVQTTVGTEDSIEGALCMSCHDGSTGTRADGTEIPAAAAAYSIGTAYLLGEHNTDSAIMTLSDGSIYYGSCTKCHEPHGSQYPALLNAPQNNSLCFKCHESATDNHKYSGKQPFEKSEHSLTTVSGSGTPIVYRDVYAGVYYDGVPRDPSNPDDVTNYAGMCFNCHVPHGRYVLDSNGNEIDGLVVKANLRQGKRIELNGNEYVSTNDACADCHVSTLFGAWYGFNIYRQTAHGDESDTLTMWDGESAPGECTNCHDPHGTNYGAMLKLPMNTDEVDADGKTLKNKVCLNCHDQANRLAKTYWFRGGDKYFQSTHFTAQWWSWVYDASQSTVDNAVYVKEKASYVPGNCMNCHSSHGNEDPNNAGTAVANQLLKQADDPTDSEYLCYYCHDEWVLASKVFINGDTQYYFTPRTLGWPMRVDSTVYDSAYLYQASVLQKGQPIYLASSHGASANVVWPGGGDYPASGSSGSYVTEFVQDGLLGYWTFDDGTANDIWANRNGTVRGATTVTGKVYSALQFDGTNDDVKLPVISLDPDGAGAGLPRAFTFEAWIWADTSTATRELFHRAAADNYGVVHYELDTSSKVRMTVRREDHTDLVSMNPSSYTLPSGQWVYISFVYEEATGGRIYINGNSTPVATQGTLTTGDIGGESMPWYIGSTASDRYFKGKIDEAKLYNRALTTEEIAQNYNATGNSVTFTGVSGDVTFQRNSCYNCHDPHGSGYKSSVLMDGPYACLECHDGSPSTKDVSTQFDGAEGHKVKDTGYISLHDPGADWQNLNKDDSTKTVQCADCHNPHVLKTKDTFVTNNLKASGVSKEGDFKYAADYQYEVCLKCHSKWGSKATLPTGWTDVRDRFQTTRDHHHGIYGSTGNTYVNNNTMTATGDVILARSPSGHGKILCSDCHYTHTQNDSTNNPYNLKMAASLPSNYSSMSAANAWRVKHCVLCHEPGPYAGDSSNSRFTKHYLSGKHRNNTYGCYSCHGGNPNNFPTELGYMHGFTWNGYGGFIRGWSIRTYSVDSIGSKSGCNLLTGTCSSHGTGSSRTDGN